METELKQSREENLQIQKIPQSMEKIVESFKFNILFYYLH